MTDGDDVESFNEFATAVTAGERDVAYDRQWFERQATDAEAATDRSMSIENAGWDEPRIEELEDDDISPDEIDDEETAHVGIISYSVTWTNFATVDDNRIYFGDAFQTDNPWFPALWDGQHLEIESPPDYALETPTQLEWTGPYQFGEDELQIIFVRSGGDSTSVAGSVVSGWMIGGIVVLLFLVGAGSYLFARRGPETDLPAPVDRIPDRAAALGIAAHVAQLRSRVRAQLGREQQQPATTDTNGSTVQSAPGTASDADGADRRSGATGTRLEYEEESDDEIDLELLSDEERVLRMLTRNGGRMKQASIVKETGWSNAKVSQLLSQMDDDEEIEKLRIGRENLITLPEVDPTELD
ncbi:helix-turn-helix transcriptional regulator [Natronorubrum sp. DTA28]|uniref:helix-turn-helix transcriptional regulator n=1 Tax=Natronorubrum sp. DTA28 TaxID=3447019 RepID=UPI003F83A6D5